MKLNLQILELELSDICLQANFLTDRLERSLRYPVAPTQEFHADPSVVYLVHADAEIILPKQKICSFLCIGNIPQSLRAQPCNWLQIDGNIERHDLLIRLHEIFERYDNWEFSLLEVIADKEPIKQIGLLSESFLRHPFQFYDSGILCVFSIYNDAYYSRPYNYPIQKDRIHLYPEEGNALILTTSYQQAMQKRTPVMIEEGFFPMRTMFQSVHLAEKFVGNLLVDELGPPFREGDFTLLHYIGKITERYLRHNNILSLGTPIAVEEILTALLEKEIIEESNLNLFLESLGFCSDDSFFCVVISPTHAKGNHNTLSLLSIQVSKATQSKCYLEYEGKLVFVFQTTPNRSREQILQIVLPILRDYFVQCGISLSFQDFQNLHDYHWQCLRALELGQAKDPTYWFYRFENYMLDHLILSSFDSHNPKIMIPEGLTRLLEYDKEHETQFVEILKTYLDHNMSLTTTAKLLYVHKNTLLYRLEKMKEILQMNLEDPDIRLLLCAALRILA